MYAFLLATLAITTIVVKSIFYSEATSGHHNYLYTGVTNLTQHSISHEPETRKILMLGNSTIAGSNIPAHNHLAHQLNKKLKNHKAYNLGSFGTSTSTVLSFFNLALQHNPEVLVMGINSSLMKTIQSNPISRANIEIIKDDIPGDLYNTIVKDKERKNEFFPKTVSYPPPFVINYKTWLHNLREKIYGPTSSTAFFGKGGVLSHSIYSEGALGFSIFKTIISKAKEKGIKVFTYIDPHYRFPEPYQRDAFNQFKKEVILELSKLGVSTIDYSKVLESTSENYLDFIHLNPKGNERFAKILLKDLEVILD